MVVRLVNLAELLLHINRQECKRLVTLVFKSASKPCCSWLLSGGVDDPRCPRSEVALPFGITLSAARELSVALSCGRKVVDSITEAAHKN